MRYINCVCYIGIFDTIQYIIIILSLIIPAKVRRITSVCMCEREQGVGGEGRRARKRDLNSQSFLHGSYFMELLFILLKVAFTFVA